MDHIPVLVVIAILSVFMVGFSSAQAPERSRLLGLHGYLENGAILCDAFNSWSEDVRDLFEFTCLNGPFKDPTHDIYSWVDVDPQTGEWLRTDESIAYVLDHMRENGPYDGIFGFSMGGCMSALLAAVIEKNMTILGRETSNIPLSYAMIYEGGLFRQPEGIDGNLFDPPVYTQSLIIIGEYDQFKYKEEELVSRFKNSVVKHVNLTHSLLTGDNMDDGLKSTIEKFLRTPEKRCSHNVEDRM